MMHPAADPKGLACGTPLRFRQGAHPGAPIGQQTDILINTLQHGAELVALQAEYAAWHDALPDSLAR
jgi:hypothetical protein